MFLPSGEHCSRCSNATARRFRVALSKGLRSLYLRCSIRAYQGSRYERIEGRDPLGSGVASRAGVSIPLGRVWLPQFFRGVSSSFASQKSALPTFST